MEISLDISLDPVVGSVWCIGDVPLASIEEVVDIQILKVIFL